MSYKTIVVDYAPKAKKMALSIEETANTMLAQGYELVTFSVTSSAKAILLFRQSESRCNAEIGNAAVMKSMEAIGEEE